MRINGSLVAAFIQSKHRCSRRGGFASPNYMIIVMSRRPPAATKPMPTSGSLVIVTAMPDQ